MGICKEPTLRLKALNKHTHIMYIEMENVIKEKKEIFSTRNIMLEMHTHARTHARTHAYIHTVQTDSSEGQRGLTEIF